MPFCFVLCDATLHFFFLFPRLQLLLLPRPLLLSTTNMSIPGLGASLSNSMTSEEPPIAMAQPAPVIQAVQVIEAPESLDQATISTSYDDTSPTPEPTRYTIEQDTKDQPRKDKLCSVCEKDPGRYKCPRCSLP